MTDTPESKQRARKGLRKRIHLGFARSLRGQLMLSIAIPIVALLLGLSLVGVFGFTRMTQTLLEERDAELVQLAARQIADYWGESVLLLSQLAAAPEVRQGDVEAMGRLLNANMALQQRFDELAVTNADGLVISAVNSPEAGMAMRAESSLGEQVGSLSYFERTRQLRRPVRSDTYVDTRGRRILTVAVPAYDPFGRFAGCVLGIWSAEGGRLGTPVESVRVGERGYAYLVDEQGFVLYHPDAELVGRNMSWHPAVESLLQNESGAQTVDEGGRIEVVGYAPISLDHLSSSLFADPSWGGWGLLSRELWDDIVAPLRPYAQLMIVLLALLVTTPLVILALAGSRIVLPLETLAAQAGRVAAGEFDIELSVKVGPSEVRDLGTAFDQMVVQLRKYRSDIQSYVVSILNSQEQERKRVARELHDDTAQALIVLGRRIELAQELAEGAQEDPCADLAGELGRLRDLVDDMLQSVRRFTRDLRPPLLEELGLSRSMEILGARVEREEGLSVDVHVHGTEQDLLPELELGLYRLAQEALSNVRRHAQASHASVILTYRPHLVSLEVQDDGVGFDAPTDPSSLVNSGRLGLMGIHERARLFGGRVTIDSKPGEGTVVHVAIPITPLTEPELDAP
ncbi:MAG: HAMP domain-containing protein [Anaerolineae bacterium]|nr:HAMP domain-containing protein [Anaerolineae bacterium]